MYALAIFLSAFLLFLVQPLLAKAILPWFGGASSVWATALVFYQAALLGGYAYAHVLGRLEARRQTLIHVSLLAVSLAWLPVLPHPEWRPESMAAPGLAVLGLLAATVLVPYLLLSATSPLLQRWLAQGGEARPYRLYAVSNAGSLLGLLCYPFLLEPALSVRGQALAWSGAYVVFAGATGALAWRHRWNPPLFPSGDAAPAPSGAHHAAWFTLAAVGAALLVAGTNEIVMDIASVPLLWVVPLGLYLVTMILAFAGRYRRAPWTVALGAALVVLAVVPDSLAYAAMPLQFGFAAGAMFAAQMICHGELARFAPAPRWLTRYYLVLSAGGAAGGASVALLAPLLLPDFWEFPLLLVGALWLLLVLLYRDERSRRGARALLWVPLLALFGCGLFAVYRRAERESPVLTQERNFFGVLRVTQVQESAGLLRRLSHGRITHGLQLLDRPELATSYYGNGSGVDLALRTHPRRRAGQPLRVAAVGLGTGTIAALMQPGDTLTFLELNPAVLEIARRDFTFLERSYGHVRVQLGDGRLLLEELLRREGAGRLDAIVVDAFSGDAVPVHLLTVEAARLYDRLLGESGILVLHGTNRYLDFVPVFEGLAGSTGRHVVHVAQSYDNADAVYESDWYLLVRDSARAARMRAAVADTLSGKSEAVRWTDGFSNLLGILRR